MPHPHRFAIAVAQCIVFAAATALLILSFGCAHQAPVVQPEAVVCPKPPYYLQACMRACYPRPPMMAIEDENGPHCLCEKVVQPKETL